AKAQIESQSSGHEAARRRSFSVRSIRGFIKMKIQSIDHVQLAMPPGQEERAREFFIGILGFEEVAKPEALAGRGGAWFKSGGANIHVGAENEFRPATKAHPALVVEGLDEIIRRCESARLPVVPAEEFGGWRRVHISDPFGNRIELMEKGGGETRG